MDTIQKSKQQFYQSYFSRYNTNSRKIWDAIKGIINIKSKSYNSPNCIEDGDEIITDPQSYLQNLMIISQT